MIMNRAGLSLSHQIFLCICISPSNLDRPHTRLTLHTSAPLMQLVCLEPHATQSEAHDNCHDLMTSDESVVGSPVGVVHPPAGPFFFSLLLPLRPPPRRLEGSRTFITARSSVSSRSVGSIWA